MSYPDINEPGIEIVKPIASTSGLYVDVENLGDDARNLLQSLFANWPSGAPRPIIIRLHVRADKVVLWRTWAQHQFKEQTVEVRGVQHFTTQQSKNSADIAIAVDAVTDFIKGRIDHIIVFSDDSDFISLFEKIREETATDSTVPHKVPFLWVLTNRDGNKSPHILEFFPQDYLYFIGPLPISIAPAVTNSPTKAVSPPNNKSSVTYTEIAETLIRELQIGAFASPDCKKMIRECYPKHSMASLDGAKFGSIFADKIWPIFKSRNVLLTKPKAPRRYQMTQAAKDSLK